jgi:hypothetical protein
MYRCHIYGIKGACCNLAIGQPGIGVSFTLARIKDSTLDFPLLLTHLYGQILIVFFLSVTSEVSNSYKLRTWGIWNDEFRTRY